MRAALVGIGAALPERVVSNAELVARLDTSEEWIERRTGIRERRRLDANQPLAELAAGACADALQDAGCEAAQVDRVMVCTITPDRLTPGLAPGVAARLGAERAGAVDLNAACAGFIYALDQAAALVESGRAGVVVVCGAEALSRITDHDDRATAPLFGDGAGAAVVAAVAGGEPGCGEGFELGSDGAHADLLYAEAHEPRLRMAGREVYRHAIARMTEAMTAALQRAGLEPTDLDLLVAHQANGRIVETAAVELGVPLDRVALHLDRVANTSSASIPLALWQAERDGRLAPGATVGLVAFGAGFVWGAGVISWKDRARAAA